MTTTNPDGLPELTASMCPSSDYAKGWNDARAALAAPAASGVDTSTNEAWAARAQEKIEAMDAAASVSERARDDRFTAMLIGIIAAVQDALGFTDEDKECSNGSLEIVAAIRELKEQALTQQRGECYCQSCKGSGEVIGLHASPSGDPQDAYEAPMACPKCDGTGDAK